MTAVLGGAGNGIQWVAMVSAVQELTSPSMQARVLGTLESVASATPGIGYVLGGLIASGWSARVTFLVAGVGRHGGRGGRSHPAGQELASGAGKRTSRER